jgi:glycosyltransferase involved in cell wall biosynthesis
MGWDFNRILDSMKPWQQRGDLFNLQFVPSPSLRLLYRYAAAVVCPSIAEGFDLSGIEAMLSGGAVVASDIKVHREIYADAADYFNPYSTLDQARAIQRVIDPNRIAYREELIKKGENHSPRYRRDAIAPLWQELFERIRQREFA